ncbi:MAG TPA: protein YgfX [Methylophilaceae bacterium]|nr:protein YgfX [Methylophilaceae bacterium]
MRPIHLDLKPSILLAGILTGAGLGACLILVFMPLALGLKLFLGVLVMVSSTYHVMDALLGLSWSLVGLELNSKGELHVRCKDGKKQSATVLGDTVVLPYLTILNLKVGNSRWRRHMLITPERVEPDAFRQLRVWLRWGRQASSDAGALEEA